MGSMGPTAGGRTANQFDLQRKKHQIGVHGAPGVPWGSMGAWGILAPRAQAGGRRPAAADGGRTANHFDLQRKWYQFGPPNRRN